MSSGAATAPGPGPGPADRKIRVVLFSGGRGSTALSRQLVTHPRVQLTVVVNGYDDGKSTGEVRRFLGDCLGPSDFRKNAARLAGLLGSCSKELVELLELRLPQPMDPARGRACLALLGGNDPPPDDELLQRLAALRDGVDGRARATVARGLADFRAELDRGERTFDFSDCSVGNILFAGCFIGAGRDFNRALADYCALVGLPAGMLQNVTDGTNAFLVALDREDRVLASEAAIVDATRRNQIDEIFLIDRWISETERERLSGIDREAALESFRQWAVDVPLNPSVVERLRAADLILYAPGTQHSSLFPSYMTPGLGAAIASNPTAVKLLITNLREDADIAGASAVEIIDRAVHYLRERGARSTPTPFLITHFLINDPGRQEEDRSYLPLGSLDRLEDPRVVRIGNYESAAGGSHDASKVVGPFIDSFFAQERRQRVAVFMLETRSLDRIGQTLLEMHRAGVETLPVEVEVFHDATRDFDADTLASLPFAVRRLGEGDTLAATLGGGGFDYVVLFESSGMYKGADVVNLLQHLQYGRVDAIWGSRRLSINDVHMAYRLLHHGTPIRGAVSYLGSHLLSLMFLGFYGRYISDTLSGARAIRAAYLSGNGLELDMQALNFRILSVLLRDRAEMFEMPVHYFPISPERVKRTTVGDGVRALWTVVWHRFKPLRYHAEDRATVGRWSAPARKRADG